MPTRKSFEHLRCSVANTAELIGDRWTTLILRDAFMGVRRFDDFQKDLGIARNVLTDRLAMLCDNEILLTRKYEDRPPGSSTCSPLKAKIFLTSSWRCGVGATPGIRLPMPICEPWCTWSAALPPMGLSDASIATAISITATPVSNRSSTLLPPGRARFRNPR